MYVYFVYKFRRQQKIQKCHRKWRQYRTEGFKVGPQFGREAQVSQIHQTAANDRKSGRAGPR